MLEQRFLINAELRANTPEQPAKPTQDESTGGGKTDANVIQGYAVLYEQESELLTGKDGLKFTEVIHKGALDNVDFSNLVMIYNHDYKDVLASVKAGTLTVELDDKGLKFKATLPGTSVSDDVYKNIQAGNLDSMSFGFTVSDEGSAWTQTDDGNYKREVNSIANLYELSVVTLPAYPDTNVNVDTRSLITNTKEKKDMFKSVNTNDEVTPVQAMEAYIRAAGNLDAETRSALTTESGKVVMPKEVITPAYELKDDGLNLAEFATVENVSMGSGSLPIVPADDTTTLVTKTEAEELSDTDLALKEVEYKVETRAGRIVISDEAKDDSAVDIIALCKKQLQRLVRNTDNQNILKLLATLPGKTAASLDDLKTIFNVNLNSSLKKTSMWIVNATAFNTLDQLKDNEGRYLLQPDVTAPSGFSLLGQPVFMLSDKAWKAAISGKANMILADMSQAVAVFRRNQVSYNWEKFDSYAQGLAIATRDDYKLIDTEAGFAITFGAAA